MALSRTSAVFLPVAFLLITALSASAQAGYTATRDYSFAAFLAATSTATDRGSTNPGATIGFDVTRHFHLFDPSLELRTAFAPGHNVSERTYQVGFKVERPIGRVRPYVDFVIGGGTLSHPQSGFTDNSVVPSFGAGVDYNLSPHWALKADFTRQSWKLGAATSAFNPNTLSVGIVYRFHFGK